MTEEWPKISEHAHTTLDEVTTAYRVAARLTRIVGLREQGPARLSAATELRMRAFTVLIRTYEETRDAIAYVRRHQGDGDSIAPSLYTGKARRRGVSMSPEAIAAQARERSEERRSALAEAGIGKLERREHVQASARGRG